MTLGRCTRSAFAAVVVLVASPASAETAPSAEKALAEALFRSGKDLYAAGKIAEACAKYVESHRVDPKPGTILNVATCHEEEGKTATAWADYTEAATLAARARQPERERFARAKIAELEPKLSFVTFQFPSAGVAEVLLDGKALTTAASGTRVPLDPGPHVVEARAPGKKPWSSSLDATTPGERLVAIPALMPVASAESERNSAPAAESGPPAPTRAPGTVQRTAGWITAGAGVAGLAVGTVFGLRTLAEKSTVDDHCRGLLCDATGLAANDAAQASASVSTVAFVVGAIVLGAGVALLVTAPSEPRPATTRAADHHVGSAPSCTGPFSCVW